MHFINDRQLHTNIPLYLKGSTPKFNWHLLPGQLIDNSIQAGIWEPHSTYAAEKLIRSGMNVADIGANIGYYTILFSHLVGLTGHVYSFEPMLDALQVTRQNVKANKALTNINLFNVALSDHNDVEPNGFFNYSWPPDAVVQMRQPIRHVTLDLLITEGICDPPQFLKIDTDGYEMKVLKGGEKYLREYHPAILLEVCDYTLRATVGKAPTQKGGNEYGNEVTEMLYFLKDLNYKLQYEEDYKDSSEVTDVIDIINKFDLSSRSINLICT